MMTSTSEYLTDAPLAGTLVGTDFEGWTPALRAEFEEHAHDGHVGSRLLSAGERVRVWRSGWRRGSGFTLTGMCSTTSGPP